MKVLIACEESQEVCKAFRAKGHEAYSCDIVECSGGHPEWHIIGDVTGILNGVCTASLQTGEIIDIPFKWDLIIAHPPCTYLSNAGARFLYKGGILQEERIVKGIAARDLFMRCLWADCEKIAVENPVPSTVYCLPKYTQTIQPYEFGHPLKKKNVLMVERTSGA